MTELLGPARIDIETARRLSQCLSKRALSVFGQKPIDKYFCCVGVSWVLDDGEIAAARRRIEAFFDVQ